MRGLVLLAVLASCGSGTGGGLDGSTRDMATPVDEGDMSARDFAGPPITTVDLADTSDLSSCQAIGGGCSIGASNPTCCSGTCGYLQVSGPPSCCIAEGAKCTTATECCVDPNGVRQTVCANTPTDAVFRCRWF